MNIIYGISNCDTIKKTRKWLKNNNIEYEFHDFRQEGVNVFQLRSWADELGWEKLVNKRSTTWRNLPSEAKEHMDETLALFLMEQQPTLIKRPVLLTANGTLIGFNEKIYASHFNVPFDR